VPPAQSLGTVNVTVTTRATSEVTPQDEYTFESEFPSAEHSILAVGPAAGTSNVTLHGVGFLEASKVLFSGTPAESFEVINDTEIKLVTPPHATDKVTIRRGTLITVTGSGFQTGPAGSTLIRIGERETTSVECSSSMSCTAVTPEGPSAKTQLLEVKVPSNINAKESPSEESEAARFTYE
jgi:hypothetical protein